MHILEVKPERIGDVYFANIRVELEKSEYFASITQSKKFFKASKEMSNTQKMKYIDYVVKDYYGYENLNTPSKTRGLVQARAIAWHFMKRFTRVSHGVMAALYERDHASVTHNLKMIDNLMETYQDIRDDLNNIEKLLKKFNVYKNK